MPKYGLIWEEDKVREQFEEDSINAIPLLREIKGMEIVTKDDDSLPNLIIEGDNYHSLTVLNYTHREAIDVIYIDPPYNTGNKDFKYNDRFVDREDTYRHSKWLSFMSKRLKLAKNLLKPTGIIFISIDDNEQANLKLLCDQIFGEENFVCQFIWRKKKGWGRGAKFCIPHTEYILCYTKQYNQTKEFFVSMPQNRIDNYDQKDDESSYQLLTLEHSSPKGAYIRKTLQYDLQIDGKDIFCSTGQWLWKKERVLEEYKNGNVVLKEDKDNRIRAFKKCRLTNLTTTPSSIIDEQGMDNNAATNELRSILNNDITMFPKPVKLIKYLLTMVNNSNALILDFFAGSGTTGHAVLDLNKEDGGSRRFILCTNNENNICTEYVSHELRKQYKDIPLQKIRR